MAAMVLPGIGSHSPFFQFLTWPNGLASSWAESCCIGRATRSFLVHRSFLARPEKVLARVLKICQSDLDSQPGVTASPIGWMKGCMSVVLRSFFSYQVAVGKMMSE